MFRWAEDKDKQAVMDLWAKDFESYEPYYSWYFSKVYRPEFTLCDFAGSRLAAMLQISPYTLQLRNMALSVVYLAGVITAPEFRGKGRGHALLTEAQRFLERQGYAAALLYTDIPDFYASLGYSHCYTRQQLELPSGEFSRLAAATDSKTIWRKGSLASDIPALAAIYYSMNTRYDGYIRRNRENWEKYLGEHDCDNARLMLAEERAYLLYAPEEEKLRIIELGFADTPALTEALAKAARLSMIAGATGLSWPAPLDTPRLLPQLPPDYWQAQPFVMARLISVQAVLDALSCPQAVRQILARLDTATVTRLVFGTEDTAEKYADLTANERRLLTELFQTQPLWINEYT